MTRLGELRRSASTLRGRLWRSERRHLGALCGTIGFFVANTVAGLLIARFLGPAGRGEVSYSFLLISAGATLGTFGLDHAATHLLSGRLPVATGDLWRLARLAALCGAVAAVLCGAAAMLFREPLSPLAVVVGIAAFALFQVGRSAALARRRVAFVSLARAVTGAAYLCATVVILSLEVADGWIVWAWALGGLTLGLSTILGALAVTPRAAADSQLSFRDIRQPGKAGWHSSLAQLVTYRLDQVVVLRISGAAALGEYSVAVFVMSVLWLVADSVGELEYPDNTLFTHEERLRRTRAVATVVSGLVAAGGLVVVLSGPFLVPRLLGDGYGRVPLLLLLLFPGTVANVWAKAASAALYAGRQGHRVRKVVMATAALVAVLTVPVVHLWGILGAAGLASCVYTLLGVQLWRSFRQASQAG
jgi:O-antigen/teichoic acid export membrane protein